MTGEGASHGWASFQDYLMGGAPGGGPGVPHGGGFPWSQHPGTPWSIGDMFDRSGGCITPVCDTWRLPFDFAFGFLLLALAFYFWLLLFTFIFHFLLSPFTFYFCCSLFAFVFHFLLFISQFLLIVLIHTYFVTYFNQTTLAFYLSAYCVLILLIVTFPYFFLLIFEK